MGDEMLIAEYGKAKGEGISKTRDKKQSKKSKKGKREGLSV